MEVGSAHPESAPKKYNRFGGGWFHPDEKILTLEQSRITASLVDWL
jgi:hypothetical protein